MGLKEWFLSKRYYDGSLDYSVRIFIRKEGLPVYCSRSSVFSSIPGIHGRDFHEPGGIERSAAGIVLDNLKTVASLGIEKCPLLSYPAGLPPAVLMTTIEALETKMSFKTILVNLATSTFAAGCVWPWTPKPTCFPEGFDGVQYRRETVQFHYEMAKQIAPFLHHWQMWSDLKPTEFCDTMGRLVPVR